MIVTAHVGTIMGHLRYGHYELNIKDEEKQKEFLSLSEEERTKYIEEYGDLLVDDYEIDDHCDVEPCIITK